MSTDPELEDPTLRIADYVDRPLGEDDIRLVAGPARTDPSYFARPESLEIEDSRHLRVVTFVEAMTTDPELERLHKAWWDAEAIALKAPGDSREAQAKAKKAFYAYYDHKGSMR